MRNKYILLPITPEEKEAMRIIDEEVTELRKLQNEKEEHRHRLIGNRLIDLGYEVIMQLRTNSPKEIKLRESIGYPVGTIERFWEQGQNEEGDVLILEVVRTEEVQESLHEV